MDTESMQQATQEAVKKKFGRKQQLVSKVTPHYPENLEREYIRVSNAYMNLFNNTLAEYIPHIRDALAAQGKYALDAAGDDPKQKETGKSPGKTAAVKKAIDRVFSKIRNVFTQRQSLFGLTARIEKISNITRKLTTAEWKRVVKRTLGINIMDDYYRGTRFQGLFDKWTSNNVGLIKSIPDETLGNMRDIVKKGYLSGATNKTIAKEIQDAYNVSKSKKRIIKAIKPDLRLDSKGKHYINTAFDIAVQELNSRKDTNYQRRQMFNADGRSANAFSGKSKSQQARDKMLSRIQNRGK